MLNGYLEAEIVGARVGASKMGFFTSPDGDGYVGDGEYEDTFNPTMNAQAGVVMLVMVNMKIHLIQQ
jgi:capsid protein